MAMRSVTASFRVSPGATIISALVASSPSTSATVENFQMPRIERSSVAFRIN